MRIALIVLAILATLVVAVVIFGLLLPRDHVASGSALYDAPPERIWALVTDTARAPGWRSGLKSAEALPPIDGRRRYREVTRFGPVTYIVEEERAPTRLVARIADEGAGFGGSWTWELVGEDSRTRVTITECGFVDNPVFRFLARFVFGHGKTIDGYLRDLGRALA